jgi:hypothetical protein
LKYRHLLAAMSLAAATCGGAAAEAAAVSGQVLRPDGSPVAAARVTLQNTLLGAVTGPDGRYSIQGVPSSRYILLVEAFGFDTENMVIDLKTRASAEADFRLERNNWIPQAAALHSEPKPERLAEKAAYLGSLSRVTPRERPNIVIVVLDDLGYGDLSSFGNRLIKTPEMDSVADAGVRLTSFYSSSPVCTPSRASLLTGRLPVRSQSAEHVFSPTGSPTAQIRRALGRPNPYYS